MKLTRYLIFILSITAMLYLVDAMKWQYEPLALNGIAMEPVIHLVNSYNYYDGKEQERSLDELESAVRKTMILKEEITHKKSLELLEVSLPDIMALLNSPQTISNSRLNETCTKMLIALTYMQVHSATVSLKEEQYYDMKESIGNAMYILKKALLIADGAERGHEVLIYSQMSELFENPVEPVHTQETLELILDELQYLEITELQGVQVAAN
ncbi:hypothetical protein [Marinoscillum sp.]|uniref:hypothetical protein n=1 Tax=Marinoscillum sp. TaxID=2024838 RepID=UPI003BAD9AE3